MNLVEEMVHDRVVFLLKEVERLAGQIVGEVDAKRKSTKVSDFTTAGDMPPEMLRELGIIQLQITLLKGMV